MNQLPDDLKLAIFEFIPWFDQQLVLRQIFKGWKRLIDNTSPPTTQTCTGKHTSLIQLRLCKCTVAADLRQYAADLALLENSPNRLKDRIALMKQYLLLFSGDATYSGNSDVLRVLAQRKKSTLICNSICFGCIYHVIMGQYTLRYLWGDAIQLKTLLLLYANFGIYKVTPTLDDWYRIFLEVRQFII